MIGRHWYRTSQGPLRFFIINNVETWETWKEAKDALVSRYVSTDFLFRQRRALSELQQKKGETLDSYEYAFEQVAMEAYPGG